MKKRTPAPRPAKKAAAKKAAKKPRVKNAGKKPPRAGAAKKPRGKGALTSAQRAASLVRVSRRRSFGLVDRLPEELRDWVREKFADPSVEYTDIAEHVLLETTHPDLREKLRDDLDWARRKSKELEPEDGAKRAAEYLRLRQEIYNKLRAHPKTTAKPRKGDPGGGGGGWGDPVLLSQSVLSRDYRRVAQSIKEVEEHLAIAGEMLSRLGTRSVSSIGILVANQLLLRLHTFVAEATSIDEIEERKHAFKAGAQFFKAVVDYERGDAKSAVALKRARQQVRTELEGFLATNPDLRDRLDAFLAEREAA